MVGVYSLTANAMHAYRAVRGKPDNSTVKSNTADTRSFEETMSVPAERTMRDQNAYTVDISQNNLNTVLATRALQASTERRKIAEESARSTLHIVI